MLATAGNNRSHAVAGARCRFPPGEYLVTQTVELEQWDGAILGSGRGTSPLYSPPTYAGNATVFRWGGPSGEPVFRVRDSKYHEFGHFRIEGEDGNPPSFGIEHIATTGEGAGTNGYAYMHDLHIGRYAWTAQGIHKGDVVSGVGYTGDNVNNDEFQIERVIVSSPSEYGIKLANTQSVGGSINDVYIYSAGVAGISTDSGVQGSNWNFYDNAIDIEIESAANVIVQNVYSEACQKFVSLGYNSYLSIYGGAVQCGAVITGDEVLIDAYPSDTQRLTLHDIKFTGMTDATKARIEIGPLSTSHVGRFLVDVHGCEGLLPTQLVLGSGSSFWAVVPMSKGVVQWQSTHGRNIYQFRNELRTSGTGTRTAIDRSVWDAPVTD